MDTISMNSKNSKTPDCYRLLLILTNKINLKRSGKLCCYIKPCIYYTWKI